MFSRPHKSKRRGESWRRDVNSRRVQMIGDRIESAMVAHKIGFADARSVVHGDQAGYFFDLASDGDLRKVADEIALSVGRPCVVHRDNVIVTVEEQS